MANENINATVNNITHCLPIDFDSLKSKIVKYNLYENCI
jgi:hypothetical protein